MKYLSWLVTTPITILAILFIVANHEKVDVKYWLYAPSYEVPLYVVALIMLAFGFLSGALFVSFRYYSLKHKYWKLKKRHSRLEKELEKQEENVNNNDNSNFKAISNSEVKVISSH